MSDGTSDQADLHEDCSWCRSTSPWCNADEAEEPWVGNTAVAIVERSREFLPRDRSDALSFKLAEQIVWQNESKLNE